MLHAIKSRARLLKSETYALYLAYRDPRTPWYAKAWAALVAGYAFSPIDLIPDFIPILGYLDDLVLVPLGVWLALKLVPVEVMADCREQAEVRTSSAKPKNWLAATIIVLIWMTLAAACIYLVYHWLK